MPARTPTPTPASAVGTGGAGARLPWWALALPVAAFAVLFLLAGPGQARATGGEPAVGRFLEQVRHTVAGR